MNYNISNTILIVILLIFFTFIIYFIYDNYIQYMFVQEGLSGNEYAALKDMNNSKYTTNYAFKSQPHDLKQNIKFKQVNTGDRTEKIVLLGEDSNVYTINLPLFTISDKNSLVKDSTNKKMNYVTMSEDGKTLWGIDTTNDGEGGKAFKYDTTKAAPPKETYTDAFNKISSTVMYGPWIGSTDLAVRNIVKKSDNEWIYVAYDGKKLKMVSSKGGGKYVETSYDNNKNFINEWNSGTTANNNYKIKVKPMLTGSNQSCYMKELSYGKSNGCSKTTRRRGNWFHDDWGERHNQARDSPQKCWQRARDHENWCGGRAIFTYKFGSQEGFNGMEDLDEEDERIEPFITGGRWVEVGSDERFQSLDVGPVQVIGVNNSGHMFINQDVHNYKQWLAGKTSYKRLISKNSRTDHNNYYYLWGNGRLGEVRNNAHQKISDTREMSEINFSIAQAKLVGVDKQGNACIWEGNKWKEILFPGSMTFKSIAYYAPHKIIFAIGTDGKLYLANAAAREEHKGDVDEYNKKIQQEKEAEAERVRKEAEEAEIKKKEEDAKRKKAEEDARKAAAEAARKAKEDADRKTAAEREAKRLAEEARKAADAAAAKANAETDAIKKIILELEAKVAKGEKKRADREAEKAKGEKEAAKANAKAKLQEKDAITKQFYAIDKKIDIVDKTQKEDKKTIYSRMLGNDYKVYNAVKHNLALAKDGAIMKGSFDAQTKVGDSNREYRSAQEEKERKLEEERKRQLEENRGSLTSERLLVQATDVPLIQSFDYNTTTNEIDKVNN
jgi:hypothetical protein